MFNEIDEEFDDVAIRTFKANLPAEHDLRKLLTKKPIRSVRRLMDCINEYKRVEEDQQQGKGKAKVIPQDRRDFMSNRYNNNRPRRDFTGQSGSTSNQVVGAQLPPQGKEELIIFLRKNIDVFAWSAYEALGVDPSFIFHHLNVIPVVISRKQPPRRSSKEHSEAVTEESKVVFEHVEDLGNIFEILRKRKLPLNASKCSFGMGSGKFSRYMVTYRGIEVNPDQVKQLKEYLSRPLVMSMPEEDEVFFAYIVVASHTVNLVDSDLVAEFDESPLEEKAKKQNMDGKSVGMVFSQEPLSWRVYVDGAVNQRGFEVGLVIISPEMIIIEKSLRLGFSTTNNETEYEALLVGMAMIPKIGGKIVEMFSDLRLVVGQVEGELEAKNPRMQEYLGQVRHLQSGFESFTLLQIPKSRNTHANSLATFATFSTQSLPRVILVEDLCKSTEMKRKMGLDIVGHFPKAVGNKRWLLVGTNYFTKWVEAEPLANIKDMDTKRFMWKNIVTRFGIPHTIILDNDIQFDSKAFKRYCCDLDITNRYSTPAYP
ncbi:uncharacterized protein LOC142628972 [Castanea sativa]|uniref:uncharacterized protein LOC142628972 n=1 Tax=Castanea sativa TaxID=21020 RepID=UPI003F64EFC1